MKGRARGVLCVGRVYCDAILSGLPRLPSSGTEIFADGLQLRAGGGAFTTAAYLSALGRPAYLAAALPAAPFEQIVLSDIAAAGVDASACVPAPPGSEPQLTVALVGAGDRAFVTRRCGPASPAIAPGFAEQHEIGHVHVGELATLVAEPWLVEFARDAGVSLSLDCGWDDSLKAEEVANAVRAADLFLPNAEEVAWLAGIGVTPGARTLWVEKRGADGAAVLGGVSAASAPAQVRDPTGAGDAFNAGFLDQWLNAATPEACLRAGNACGAVAVGCIGGFDAARARPLMMSGGRTAAL